MSRLIVLTFLSSVLLPESIACAAEGTAPRNADCIKPDSRDARYWQFKGQRVLLLGGSKTDHIFLLDDLKQHLDEIARTGGNYVRNTMSQREGLDLKPHARRGDGQFDLDKWNDDYWQRFANCLKWCNERDIIIQIEVWDRFDFSRDNWQDSPWRPANNVNYTGEQTGLADEYPWHPGRDMQPFFHTIPGMERYEERFDLIRRHQERFVEKMLSYSLPYGNVLYCMNNETNTPLAWGQHWMRFIRERAAEAGVEVYATDMFDDVFTPRQSAKLRVAFDDPGMYPFVEASQVNSRTFDEDHWVNIRWIVEQTRAHPRPVNHVKIYSDGETSFGSGTPQDGVERFWRDLIAGSAAVRFHRPGAGIGLNETAKACIRAARKVESLVPFWDVEPAMHLLSDRDSDEAYIAADGGERFIVFFTDGGNVRVDLSSRQGTFDMRWVNVSTGEWGDSSPIEGGRPIPIGAPSGGPWVAVLMNE